MSTPNQPVFPVIHQFKPGIQRDGTLLENLTYSDGQWCRFMRGRPRKMGGYSALGSAVPGPVRGVHIFPFSAGYYIHVFSQSKITKIQTDEFLNVVGTYDRTPAGLLSDPANNWQFDVMWDGGSLKNYLVAHCTNNLSGPNTGTSQPIFYGDVSGTSALVSNGTSVDGGIVALHPYLFAFGSNGFIQWSAPDIVTTMSGSGSGSARVAAMKIIRGMNTRGGPSNSPAGIFWALDNVIRCAFVGGAPIFSFDDISDASSVMSSNGMVEFDGLYYWMANGRFQAYNGTVIEVPNLMNVNWLFKNINWNQRQKIWATKVEQYGEIHWHVPMFNSTECNWDIVYNVREGSWYDTPSSRSAGYYAQALQYPIWADSTPNDPNGNYLVWLHEYGFDQVISGQSQAILSFFETAPATWMIGQNRALVFPGRDRWVELKRFEPDFNQTGEMSLIVRGRRYATDQDQDSDPITFNPVPTDPKTQRLTFQNEQRRQLRLKVISNTVGGFYESGNIIDMLDIGDGRQ